MHRLTLLATFLRPGGVRAVAAESLLLKHQLRISQRSRRRAPTLTSRDRVLLSLTALVLNPRRIPTGAVILKPATRLTFHQALAPHKYHWLVSSSSRRKPGPHGPSPARIAAIVEMKRRHPRFGCPRIAQHISRAVGLEINTDVVRRVLAMHFRPESGHHGPSGLTFLGHMTDSLWSVDLFRCESIRLKSHWVRVGMDVCTRRIMGFSAAPADIEGVAGWRMFTRAMAGHAPPTHLSSDHDPLCTFHRWRANLRVRDVDEMKTLPLISCSHPFVERLIGTIRREYLDYVLFWHVDDLTRKLDQFKAYYNEDRVHRSLYATPAQASGKPPPPPLHSVDMPGASRVGGSFIPQWPLDEEFATHRSQLTRHERSASEGADLRAVRAQVRDRRSHALRLQRVEVPRPLRPHQRDDGPA